MIKAILFDMDGVLIESHKAWVYLFNKALKKFEGRELSIEEFDKSIWSNAFDKIAKEYFSVPPEKVRDYFKEVYEDYKKRLKVDENAKETLSALKSKGLKLAVVSNTQRSVIKKTLSDVGLAKFFDFFIGGDDVEHGKPEPDLLYKAMGLLKLKKDEALFIGDTKYDKMAAEKAGIKFIGFKIDGDERVNDLRGLVSIST